MQSSENSLRTHVWHLLLLAATVLCIAACSGSGAESSGGAGGRGACSGLNARLHGVWTRIEGTTAQLPERFRLTALDDVSGTYEQQDLGALRYALGDDCASILLIDGAGHLYRTWHFTLEGEEMHVLGPWSRTSRYSRDLPAPTVSISAERPEVWANGAENVEVILEALSPDGRPLPSALVWLAAVGGQATIDPPGAIWTDDRGRARFLVTTTMLGDFVIEGALRADPWISARATLHGVRRRMVVLVQGIRTSIDPRSSDRPFPTIRSKLVEEEFWRPVRGVPETPAQYDNGVDDDGDGAVDDGAPLVADFSYVGGDVDVAAARWRPRKYECPDTSRSHRSAVDLLEDMLEQIASGIPNTSLSVVGHSQGGLIALQILEGVLPPDSMPYADRLHSVVTLDGALGGTPTIETWITGTFTCWGDPAAGDMVRLWRSATDHDRQGSTAISMAGISNDELVSRAIAENVQVLTVGNELDCVFVPGECNLPLLRNNESTQYVDAAVEMKVRLDAGCIGGPSCIGRRHSAVLEDTGVMTRMAEFLGDPFCRD